MPSVDGLLLLDKPVGWSSNHALQRARRLCGASKGGHGGTLDPAASGLLVLCLGEATKFSSFLLDSDKSYTGVIRLGVTTSTGDAEGDVLERAVVRSGAIDIPALCGRFTGTQVQTPPRYSALKHHGRPLYAYAREGVVVEAPPREIQIRELSLEFEPPDNLRFSVRCSRGTYIRSLAEDIGRDIGCGAHLAGLRRVASGAFRVDDAVTLEQLEALAPEARLARVLPPDAALQSFPALRLEEHQAVALSFGQAVQPPPGAPSGRARVYDSSDRFLGLGEVRSGGELVPLRLMAGRARAGAAETS